MDINALILYYSGYLFFVVVVEPIDGHCPVLPLWQPKMTHPMDSHASTQPISNPTCHWHSYEKNDVEVCRQALDRII